MNTNNRTKDQLIADITQIINNANLPDSISNTAYENTLHHLRYNIGICGSGYPPKHEEIPVFNPMHNKFINVDKNIAQLIECIWLNDISTTMSCENNIPANYIWIRFTTPHDLNLFLAIIFEGLTSGDDLYDRGLPGWGTPDGWYYDVTAYQNEGVSIGISIRFPQKDYYTVLEKLTSYYERTRYTFDKMFQDMMYPSQNYLGQVFEKLGFKDDKPINIGTKHNYTKK